MTSVLRTAARGRAPWRPGPERLEARELPAGSGYVLSGFRWSNPADISFSIVPDGVPWDGGTNGLNAFMNARFGDGTWQRELARALQTWASVANINIAQVPDSGPAFDAFGQPQSDPRFGDIRVGGFNFSDPRTLAQTFYPPPNG